MDLFYHPILGLQITFGCPFFEVDLDVMQIQEYNLEKFIEMIRQRGVVLQSKSEESVVRMIPRITSNVNCF